MFQSICLRSASAIAAALWLAAPAAHAQSPCEFYTVVSGDTLSQIARRADVPGGYQTLFSVNNDTLRNPNVIEVGTKLRIPCADGSLPVEGGTQTAVVTVAEPEPEPAPEPEAVAAAPEPAPEAVAAAPAADPEAPADEPAPEPEPVATAPAAEPEAPEAPEAPAAAPAEPLPPIRFLTGGAYAPFTDESLPQQGLFTELVRTALNGGDPNLESSVTFVNDWGPHLSVLLPSGAFDAGFPWYQPDCTKVEFLEPANAQRCTDYNHSDPFFEAVVAYYTLKDSPFATVTAHPQLLGARLCRPRGWFTFDLEAARLVEPNVTMLVAPTQIACWDALMKGEVDVVTFDALPAEADIQSEGLADQVIDLPELATLSTLHVFTPKTNPNGLAYLQTLNNGLAEMRKNGQWLEIVSRHLAAHDAKKAP